MAGNSVQYSTNLVIPDGSSVKDAVTNQELTYAFNGMRALAIRIDETTGSLSPPPDQWSQLTPTDTIVGGDGFKFYCVCSSPITFGQFVSFTDTGSGTVSAAPALADSYLHAAYGYCLTPSGFDAGDIGEFRVGPGVNYGISGMTPGLPYFLSDTVPGSISTGPGTTPGHIYQCLGVALTDRVLSVGCFNNWRVI